MAEQRQIKPDELCQVYGRNLWPANFPHFPGLYLVRVDDLIFTQSEKSVQEQDAADHINSASVTSAFSNNGNVGHSLSSIQTLGPMNSISENQPQSSHFQQGPSTFAGAGFQPMSNPMQSTLTHSSDNNISGCSRHGGGSEEHRPQAPFSNAPSQVTENDEHHYPTSSYTGQQSVTAENFYPTFSLDASSATTSSIYGGAGGESQLCGYSGSGVNTGQYAPGVAQQQQQNPPPPSFYDNRNTASQSMSEPVIDPLRQLAADVLSCIGKAIISQELSVTRKTLELWASGTPTMWTKEDKEKAEKLVEPFLPKLQQLRQ